MRPHARRSWSTIRRGYTSFDCLRSAHTPRSSPRTRAGPTLSLLRKAVALLSGSPPARGRTGRRRLLFLEWVLPAGGRAPRRECDCQIVEHDRAVVARKLRHVVALAHEVDRVVPLGTGLALLRHDAEAVAGRAGDEGLFTAGAGRIVGGALITWWQGLCDCVWRRTERRQHKQRADEAHHHAIRIATRCIGLAP